MSTFGYSPGDRVPVFCDGRVLRELEFVSEREGGQGVVCKSESGALVRFNRSGKQHGRGSDRGAPFIVKKAELASFKRVAVITGLRADCRRAINEHVAVISMKTVDLRFGPQPEIRERAEAIARLIEDLVENEANA